MKATAVHILLKNLNIIRFSQRLALPSILCHMLVRNFAFGWKRVAALPIGVMISSGTYRAALRTLVTLLLHNLVQANLANQTLGRSLLLILLVTNLGLTL